MATVTENPIGQDSLPGAHDLDLAARRVTAYFRYLGLPAGDAVQWAEKIVGDVQKDNGVDVAGGCSGRAMDRAMSRVDEWLEAIAGSWPESRDDLAAQLKWHLRPVLQQHPESFLRTEDLSEDVHRAIREAARPILPPALPAVMPAQSFGDLPRPWQRTVAYAGLIRGWLVNALWRMWR